MTAVVEDRENADETAAASVEVREVAGRRDLDRFLRLPWKIYANDPAWVPPLLVEVKAFLDRRKHPFYLHGDATTFLALRGGEPAGRILVSDDPNFNRAHGANAGCFGLFESVDDPAVAGSLLDAAAGWLRNRGRDSILGPIDYSLNYPAGLLIDGFDTPPRVMMNHNPPYYARLLEAWGLEKAKDLYAWWFDDPDFVRRRWKRRGDWLARRGGITIRHIQKGDFDAEVERLRTIYCEAFEQNWGFVDLTQAEFAALARQISQLADPRLVLIAEVEGKPVGFSITVPDLNEAIRPLNGRLTWFGLPIGLARLLWRLKRARSARMMVLVVLPEYRRRGVSETLILHTVERGVGLMGFREAELGWTLEDNDAINRTIETVGGRRYKTYRVYQKSLAAPPSA